MQHGQPRTRPRRISWTHSRAYTRQLGKHSNQDARGNLGSGGGTAKGEAPKLSEVCRRYWYFRFDRWTRLCEGYGRKVRQSRNVETGIRQAMQGPRLYVEEQLRTGCAGIVSHSKDHYHYFFDLDDIEFSTVLYAAMFIAQEFKCDILIRESSSRSFHLVCPNPMSADEVITLQRFTPSNDRDNWVHLDDILYRQPLHGTGNTLRLSGKGPQTPMPKNLKTLWVGQRAVCEAYAKIFNLKVPPMRELCHCSPTFTYYTTKLRSPLPWG